MCDPKTCRVRSKLDHLRVLCFIAILFLTIGCARIVERRDAGVATSTAPAAQVPASPVRAATQAVASDSIEKIVSGGQTRQYRLHVPPSYRAGQVMPLVINIHGYNSNAEQQERISKMAQKADQAGFIAVHPEGTGGSEAWHFGPGEDSKADLQFFGDLIRTVESKYSIDANRIYATGISNGAQMTNHLGCAMSDMFAAIAPVSGGYFRGEACNTSRPVAVVAFHGTADNLLPYEGRPPLMISIKDWAAGWAARNGCNASPQVTMQKGQVTGETWSGCKNNSDVVLYTIKDGGHSWPGSDLMPRNITTLDIDATDTIWDFFVAHSK